MRTAIAITFLTGIIYLDKVQSLNILGIFPYQGKSHFYVFNPYLKELAKRGHNVTVISYFPQTAPIKNYHDISLADKAKVLEDVFPLSRSYWTFIQVSLFLFSFATDNCKVMLADEQVQSLWKTKRKFDIIVVEQFNGDCSLGLAYQLGAPVVGITSHSMMSFHYNRYGMPYNPSYMHVQFFEGGTKPSFYQRIERFVAYVYLKIMFRYFSQRNEENTLRQYFEDVPSLEELGSKIKFILLYQHYSLSGSSLLPANVKEIGGLHIAKPKSLPQVSS